MYPVFIRISQKDRMGRVFMFPYQGSGVEAPVGGHLTADLEGPPSGLVIGGHLRAVRSVPC
jgi:hypothetical protein